MASILTSFGEIIDKYTILLIKSEKIIDPIKYTNVRKELDIIKPIVDSLILDVSKTTIDIKTLIPVKNLSHKFEDMIDELKEINLKLWDIEDNIRNKEKIGSFDEEFISLARNVYKYNDNRARIKYTINQLTQSPICEEKSY